MVNNTKSMEKDPPPPRPRPQPTQEKQKKTFCRFYLRGLCIYDAVDCTFAHGVDDLIYDYYQEGEHIEYDYHKKHDDAQKNIIKGPRIYKSLYEFQGGKEGEKAFALE